jgi:hypothetical protein
VADVPVLRPAHFRPSFTGRVLSPFTSKKPAVTQTANAWLHGVTLLKILV